MRPAYGTAGVSDFERAQDSIPVVHSSRLARLSLAARQGLLDRLRDPDPVP